MSKKTSEVEERQQITHEVVQIVKDNFIKFDDQQKVLQVVRLALIEFEDRVFTQQLAKEKMELVERILALPRKFWEDEDHAVGGYISKKDLKELLEALKSEEKEEVGE